MDRTTGSIGHSESLASVSLLREVLAPDILPFFDASFIRSHLLYHEFVYRLALQVVRETELESAMQEPGSPEEVADRAKLASSQAVIPLDWLLRFLAARGAVEELPGRLAFRYRGRGPLPQLDPVPLREEQRRYEPSWMPAYVLAETAAREYPAFLRGEVVGEDVLFSARRLRLWIDYFSNDHGLYAVNNRLGAVAFEQWLPRPGAVVLELGGGLGSGALAVLDRLEAAGRLGAIAEYRFTEFVAAFLRRGEQTLRARHSDHAFFRFAPFDMNRSFEEQGVALGSISVVYAVNTLHVAHDLGFTLGEILRALEPRGRLIISECVRPHPRQPIPAEFVFNLTKTFRSPRLHPVHRPSGGFLTPEQWKGLLEAAGLVDVRVLPDIARLRDRVPDFSVAAIGATRAG
jgi:SAM-dependent methyltransferase